MGKSAGAAPDYQGLATQQGDISKQNVGEQTAANRPNINTPFSTQNWTKGPNGEWQLTTGLAGGLGGAVPGLQQQAADAVGKPLDPSLFGPIKTGDQAREQAINASYGQAASRLDPRLGQQEEQLRSRLANQGLDPNSQAYRQKMGEFERTRNDAYGSAMNSAIGQGTEAGTAVWNQNAQANQIALSNALKQQQNPLDIMQRLQGLSTSAPNFMGAGVAQTPELLASGVAQGNYDLQNAEQQNQAWGSALQGLFGLGGSIGSKFAMGSDARLKKNIKRLPEKALPGVPFASWQWLDGTHAVGVIAQDMEKVAPRYVSKGRDGFLRVDYRFLWESPRA